jgi:hypothetical protein
VGVKVSVRVGVSVGVGDSVGVDEGVDVGGMGVSEGVGVLEAGTADSVWVGGISTIGGAATSRSGSGVPFGRLQAPKASNMKLVPIITADLYKYFITNDLSVLSCAMASMEWISLILDLRYPGQNRQCKAGLSNQPQSK